MNSKSTSVDAAELDSLVKKIISLDLIERKIIHFRTCEALTYEQISLATGLSERSIKKILENIATRNKGLRLAIEGSHS